MKLKEILPTRENSQILFIGLNKDFSGKKQSRIKALQELHNSLKHVKCRKEFKSIGCYFGDVEKSIIVVIPARYSLNNNQISTLSERLNQECILVSNPDTEITEVTSNTDFYTKVFTTYFQVVNPTFIYSWSAIARQKKNYDNNYNYNF